MQPHRSNARDGAAAALRSDGRTHACCGRAAVIVLVSTAPGPHVRGCIRAPRHFGPYMVPRYLFWLIRAGTHELRMSDGCSCSCGCASRRVARLSLSARLSQLSLSQSSEGLNVNRKLYYLLRNPLVLCRPRRV